MIQCTTIPWDQTPRFPLRFPDQNGGPQIPASEYFDSDGLRLAPIASPQAPGRLPTTRRLPGATIGQRGEVGGFGRTFVALGNRVLVLLSGFRVRRLHLRQ
jgi:hypothetical protein